MWRTGIAYITTGHKKFKSGIMRAFRKTDKGNYQACRCNPNIGVDDVSRDQVILAWSSLYINNDISDLRKLVLNTKYRLSKRFIMTPSMWLWSRGLVGSSLLGQFGQFFLMLEMMINVVYNSMIKNLIGYKDYRPEELEKMMKEPSLTEPWREKGEELRDEFLDSKWKKLLWSANFPGYGLHLVAWMNYTGPNGILKSINNWLIKKDMSKYNLLLKLLTGGNVIYEEIEQFIPREEWIWSSRFDKGNRGRVLVEKVDYNLDKEILKTIKKRNGEMEKIKWNDDYKSEFCKIDSQHKNLFKIFNSICSKFLSGRSLKNEINKLVNYGYYHFKLEEIVYKKYNILLVEHINEHNTFVDYVINLQSLKREEITSEHIDFLRIWLYNHITIKDVKLFTIIKNQEHSYLRRKLNKLYILFAYFKINIGII